MSGKPNQTEIQVLLMNLERLIELREANTRSSRLIEEHQALLKKNGEEYAILWSKCKALIEGMDVKSEGNYGFEGRYHWFILELVTQAKASARSVA